MLVDSCVCVCVCVCACVFVCVCSGVAKEVRQGLCPANCLLRPATLISKLSIHKIISKFKDAITTYTVVITMRFGLAINACYPQAATKTHNHKSIFIQRKNVSTMYTCAVVD